MTKIIHFSLQKQSQDDLYISLLKLNDLSPLEEINQLRAESLAKTIKQDGVWTSPILVHKEKNFIMDGNHRLEAAKQLYLSIIPVYLICYDNPILEVKKWINGDNFDTNLAYKTYLNREKLGYKTTRHNLKMPLPKFRFDLELLK